MDIKDLLKDFGSLAPEVDADKLAKEIEQKKEEEAIIKPCEKKFYKRVDKKIELDKPEKKVMNKVEESAEPVKLLTKEELLSLIADGNIPAEFEPEDIGQGVGYKADVLFDDVTDDTVIYIPEYGYTDEPIPMPTEDGIYTKADFIRICDGDKELAEELFGDVDWQFPESLYNEWMDAKNESVCSKLNRQMHETVDLWDLKSVLNDYECTYVTDLTKDGELFTAWFLHEKDDRGLTGKQIKDEKIYNEVAERLRKEFPNENIIVTSRQYKYAPEQKAEWMILLPVTGSKEFNNLKPGDKFTMEGYNGTCEVVERTEDGNWECKAPTVGDGWTYFDLYVEDMDKVTLLVDESLNEETACSGSFCIDIPSKYIDRICTMGSNDLAVEEACAGVLRPQLDEFSTEDINKYFNEIGFDMTDEERASKTRQEKEHYLVWDAAWTAFEDDERELDESSDGTVSDVEKARMKDVKRATAEYGKALDDFKKRHNVSKEDIRDGKLTDEQKADYDKTVEPVGKLLDLAAKKMSRHDELSNARFERSPIGKLMMKYESIVEETTEKYFYGTTSDGTKLLVKGKDSEDAINKVGKDFFCPELSFNSVEECDKEYDEIINESLIADNDLLNHDAKFRYMMLSRMQQDCEYFLGNGNGNEKHLWAGNVEDQIKYMKDLWNSFEEKPEWLSMEDIEKYEKDMLAKRDAKNESSDKLVQAVADQRQADYDKALEDELAAKDEVNAEHSRGSQLGTHFSLGRFSKLHKDRLEKQRKLNRNKELVAARKASKTESLSEDYDDIAIYNAPENELYELSAVIRKRSNSKYEGGKYYINFCDKKNGEGNVTSTVGGYQTEKEARQAMKRLRPEYVEVGSNAPVVEGFFTKGELTSLPKKEPAHKVGDKITINGVNGEIIKVKPMKMSDTATYQIKLDDGKTVWKYEEEINESSDEKVNNTIETAYKALRKEIAADPNNLKDINKRKNQFQKIIDLTTQRALRNNPEKSQDDVFTDVDNQIKDVIDRVKNESEGREVLPIKFVCIDEWNRPIFKPENKQKKYYLSDVNNLFSEGATEQEVKDFYEKAGVPLRDCITFHGYEIDTDPNDGKLKFDLEIV